MIELIPMNQEQITAVYHEAMEQDFPANELKPLRMILQLMESGDYDSLMITNEGITVGYVLLMFPGREQVGLIDYLAIYPEQRSLGFGGKVLQKLKEYYPDGILYLECEHPTDAPKPQLAERRIRFYERNGAVRIPLESKVFGAPLLSYGDSGKQTG